MQTEFTWGPASVAYPDWKGTAQIDQKMTGDNWVYDIVGIDHDEWTVIGFDFGGGDQQLHKPQIVAVPAGTDLSARRVEATMFQLHEVEALDLLLRMIHSFDMRFRSRAMENTEIVITRLDDIPAQD